MSFNCEPTVVELDSDGEEIEVHRSNPVNDYQDYPHSETNTYSDQHHHHHHHHPQHHHHQQQQHHHRQPQQHQNRRHNPYDAHHLQNHDDLSHMHHLHQHHLHNHHHHLHNHMNHMHQMHQMHQMNSMFQDSHMMALQMSQQMFQMQPNMFNHNHISFHGGMFPPMDIDNHGGSSYSYSSSTVINGDGSSRTITKSNERRMYQDEHGQVRGAVKMQRGHQSQDSHGRVQGRMQGIELDDSQRGIAYDQMIEGDRSREMVANVEVDQGRVRVDPNNIQRNYYGYDMDEVEHISQAHNPQIEHSRSRNHR